MVKNLIGPRGSRRDAGNSGAAAVELSFMLPVLVLLALGAADYGALMGSAASLESATRSVAEYARNSPACAAGGLADSNCITGINNLVTTLKSNNTAISSATFTPSSVQTNAANYCTCSDGSSVSCSSTSCALADPRVLQYIQIVADQTYTPLVSYASFFSSFPATGQTTIRIQ
jgi:Flp pilus assembly protein TadG